MRTSLVSTAALSAAALTLGLAGPASADSIGVTDPRDTSHGSDLRSVQVEHRDRAVVVTTTHTNLRKDPASGSGGTVYLDTDRGDRGPEYVVVGGYFMGTDYQVLRTEGFGRKQWGAPAPGSYEMALDFGKEQVRTWISRRSLGAPDEVRVAVRVSGTRRDGTSKGLVDWLGEPRSFTRWVERG